MDTDTLVISKMTIKRLIKDVKELIGHPLSENGIYYFHSDDNILQGYAVIIGPRDTPYSNGYYIFKFNFPPEYPHKPPKLTFLTTDGITRFNPNLYRSGKVCISILNTWRGPQWTGCQTISSVLLCLCSAVLTDTPLVNEPGIKLNHPDYKNYNEILYYKNYEVAILKTLENVQIKNKHPDMYEVMRAHFTNNFSSLIKQFENDKTPDKIIQTTLYNMKIQVSYSNIEMNLNEMYKKLKQ